MTAGHPYYQCRFKCLDLVVDNVASSGGLPSVVTPPGDLASSPASRSPARSFHRVGVSSGEDWSGDGVHRSSPL